MVNKYEPKSEVTWVISFKHIRQYKLILIFQAPPPIVLLLDMRSTKLHAKTNHSRSEVSQLTD